MTSPTFHLAELTPPAEGTQGTPSAVFAAYVRLAVADSLDKHGNDDDVTSNPGIMLRWFADQSRRQAFYVVAIAGERPADAVDGRIPGVRGIAALAGPGDPAESEIVGGFWCSLERDDNTHLVNLDTIKVDPAWRNRGVGSALAQAADALARHHDRTTLISWLTTPPVDPGPDTIADPTGTIHIDAGDRDVRFALAHGYRLAQAERHSVQPLPVDETTLDRLWHEAEAAARPAYELVSWQDAAPDELLGGLPRMLELMSTDTPLGETDYRPEEWDAGRWRWKEERNLAANSLTSVVARHVETGQIVAYTSLSFPHDKPEVGFQEDTIVDSAHRGHRLGMWMKAENVRLAQALHPRINRIHTWNADENAHMLAINVALGYAVASIDGSWQKVLEPKE